MTTENETAISGSRVGEGEARVVTEDDNQVEDQLKPGNAETEALLTKQSDREKRIRPVQEDIPKSDPSHPEAHGDDPALEMAEESEPESAEPSTTGDGGAESVASESSQKEKDREFGKSLRSQLSEERRARKKYATELHDAQERIRELEQSRAEANSAGMPDDDDPKPSEDDFDDYSAYIDAKVDWSVRQQLKSHESSVAAEMPSSVPQSPKEKAFWENLASFNAEGAERYSDFAQKVTERPASELPVSTEVAEALLENDYGVDIAYYLGAHPDEAKALDKAVSDARNAGMSPQRTIDRAIGRLEVLSMTNAQTPSADQARPATKPNRPTQAPSPITPVQGNADVSSVDMVKLAEINPQEFRRRRMEQMKRRNRAGLSRG